MQNSVYVVVTQTGTLVSRLIKLFTRKPFNHASISGDLNLSEMYSFCRTYKRFPFPATFNKETIGKGVLGMYSFIACEIYEIPINAKQKMHYTSIINHFLENRRLYSYNYLGLCSIFFNINMHNKRKFVCSQFTAYVLEQIGINIKKPPSLCTPEDLRHISEAKLIYKGDLIKYYKYNRKNVFFNHSVNPYSLQD